MDAELGQLRAALSRERAHRERAVAERDAQRGRRIVRAADRAAAVVRSARALTRQPVRALRRPRPQAADLESVAPLSVVAERPGPPVALQLWSQRHWARHTGSPTGESIGGRAPVRSTAHATGAPLRILGVLTPETAAALAPDCELLTVDVSTWREDAVAFSPDLLLVEPVRHEPGDIRVTGAFPLPDDLGDLLDWCESRSVPTVFWHNTDPARFESYLGTAARFDFVFTPDADQIPALRRELGHPRIGLLPFAGQPRHFSPVTSTSRADHVVFAGGYYPRARARTRDFHEAVTGIEQVTTLDIYDPNPGATLPHHTYPPAMRDRVRGYRDRTDLPALYRHALIGLNLSTVKGSSTHFPSRVCEYMLSATPVISNHTEGLRTVFGELVMMADGADRIGEHVARLRDDDHRDRLTTAALRKTLREHTWKRRLQHISVVVLGDDGPSLPEVGALCRCTTPDDVAVFAAALQRQQHVIPRGIVVADAEDVLAAAAAVGLPAHHPGTEATVGDLLPGVPVAVIDPADWYGPHYLESLVQARAYDDAAWVTKSEHHAFRDGLLERLGTGTAHTVVAGPTVAPRRSLAAPHAVTTLRPQELLAETAGLMSPVRVISVDRFDYCAGGVRAPADLVAGTSTDVPDGVPLADIDSTTPSGPLHPTERADLLMVNPERWPTSPPPGSELRLARHGVAALRIRRDEDAGAAYLWVPEQLSVDTHLDRGALPIRVETRGDLDVRSVVRWLDSAGRAIRSVAGLPGTNERHTPPAGAASFEMGLRVTGTGVTDVRLLAIGRRDPIGSPSVLIPPALVIADAYPSYDNIYRYGFVHSRVREYRRLGVDVDVFRYGAGEPDARYEFEGVTVRTGDTAALRDALTRNGRRNVLVHFLSRDVWQALRDVADQLQITVFVHGWEVQGWWHRPWASEAERQQAERASAARTAFWRDLLADPPASVRFVFVSRFFMEQTLTDLGRDLPAERRAVIPNPIDTTLFRYVEKKDSDRLKILSVRPYTGPVYGNDLAVAAVLELVDEPWFDELSFRFVGDGPLFEETLAPLRGLPNVTIERGFRTQSEIAQLHRDHGVFLVPTRADTHGVSRDEAMASGLVPVTSAVAAVPEFVSSAEGYLAPVDDAHGLADAVRDLYADPAGFRRRSRAAAERVRTRTSTEVLVPRELAFALRTAAAHGS